MGPIEKQYEDDGIVLLRADSGGRKFTVSAQRVNAHHAASVRCTSQGTISPRQADDFAALLQAAAQEARA